MNNQRVDETVGVDNEVKRDSETASDTTVSATGPTEVIPSIDPSKLIVSSAENAQTCTFIYPPATAAKLDQTDAQQTEAHCDPGATIDQVSTTAPLEQSAIDTADPSNAQTFTFIHPPAVEVRVDQTVSFEAPASADPRATIDLVSTPAGGDQGTMDFVDPAAGYGHPTTTKISVFDSEGSAGSNNWPTVAGYQILGELGRGGMGVVYKARQRGLHRLVALKMILAGAHASEQQLVRFNIEAEAVARLQHPNIVQIHEVGEQEGLPYFSLEFVDGGPLNKKISGIPQPPREAALMIETLARAMHFAHEQGIIHRDLKPANILMTQNGVPKITDFGLAKRLDESEGDSSQTKSGTIMGTPSYMAPEQARGDIRKVGPLSDLYTLGAILYELLTGRQPFHGANAMETVIQVTRDEPVAPSRLQPKTPFDLETICLKCLQKEPAKRYADCFALADDLHRFLAGEPILARPISGAERLWRWCLRNPTIATLSAAVFSLLLVGCVGLAWAVITIRGEKELAQQNEQKAITSEGIAKQQKLLAEENEQKAIASEKIAESQADLALNTLGLLINKVQTQLGKQPGEEARQLKNALLKTAMEGLKKVTGGAAGKMRRNTMDAYFRMGGIARELGNTKDVVKYCQEYHELAQAALKDNPDNDRLKLEMAWSYRFLGDVSAGQGDFKKALSHYQSAVALRRELADLPVAERLRRNANLPEEDRLTPRLNELQVSEDYTLTALMYYFMGDSTQAEGPLLKSLAIRENHFNQAVRDQAVFYLTASPISLPTVLIATFGVPGQAEELSEIRQNLARNYHLIGEIYFRLRNLKLSRVYYQKCEDTREAILRDDEISMERLKQIGKPRPPDTELMGDLAEFHQMYGALLLALGSPPSEVLPHLDRSISLIRRVLEIDKAVGVRQNLGKALYSRGVIAVRAGDRVMATKCFNECLEIREELAAKDDSSYRKKVELLEVLARSGKHDRATQLAEQLRPNRQKNPQFLISAARSYAQSSLAVMDKPALQRQYLETALRDLQTALEQGYKDMITLETSPDLDPLRENPAFKKLLENGSKPAPPTK
jgi:serine/threonine protein kinase/tetratricopeptide (TPR) repeat protein